MVDLGSLAADTMLFLDDGTVRRVSLPCSSRVPASSLNERKEPHFPPRQSLVLCVRSRGVGWTSGVSQPVASQTVLPD